MENDNNDKEGGKNNDTVMTVHASKNNNKEGGTTIKTQTKKRKNLDENGDSKEQKKKAGGGNKSSKTNQSHEDGSNKRMRKDPPDQTARASTTVASAQGQKATKKNTSDSLNKGVLNAPKKSGASAPHPQPGISSRLIGTSSGKDKSAHQSSTFRRHESGVETRKRPPEELNRQAIERSNTVMSRATSMSGQSMGKNKAKPQQTSIPSKGDSVPAPKAVIPKQKVVPSKASTTHSGTSQPSKQMTGGRRSEQQIRKAFSPPPTQQKGNRNTCSTSNNKNSDVDNENARKVYQKIADKAKEARRKSVESQPALQHNESRPSASAEGNVDNADNRKEPAKKDGVIDLTEDSPDEDANAPSVALDVPHPSTSTQVKTQNDEESAAPPPAPSAPLAPPPPSPPASPIPQPIKNIPLPSPKPNPKAFTSNRQITFLPDRTSVQTSGNLRPRQSCRVEYDIGFHLDGSGSCLDDTQCVSVTERLVCVF